jgi:glycosyltransferase involved in cell wall biosynthesis
MAEISEEIASAPVILWNHRWEYDKRPDRFEALLDRLADRGVNFEIALLGPRPERVPDELSAIRDKHATRVVADGMVPRSEYEALLRRARVVVSTADHEFQGLSMIEAVSAGAIPVVPDALCYREQYPDGFRYTPGNIEEAADRVSDALQYSSPVDISRWTASHTGALWRNLMMYFSLPVGAIEDTNGTAAWDFYTG